MAEVKRLRLKHYKGFEEFTLQFRSDFSVLVGPNNAGKSTIISALRLCANLLVVAKRKKLTELLHDETRGRRVRGGFISEFARQFISENVRYEFRSEEARLELEFTNGAAMYLVWPVDGDSFFYLEHIEGMQPKNLPQVREFFPAIGVVASLSPVEHEETKLSANHVRDNLSSKLVSRHFRNQLQLFRDEDFSAFENLLAYLHSNTPEIRDLELIEGSMSGPQQLDLYFRELSGTSEREIFWAGDGLQIWVQVLFHIWRLKDHEVVLLDEPDVFLHPDLQRRLVRVLEEQAAQVLLATHAPEVLTEANRDSVIIVDRKKKRSRRVSDEKVLGQLNDVLGSGFNLRLAKALRSRVALFVEGKDMRVLKNIARALSADLFYKEIGLSVTPMEGASNRDIAGSFGWLNDHLLEGAVAVRLVLDRDYMTDDQCFEIVHEFEEKGVEAHIWSRKELESYLLHAGVISRVSGASVADVEGLLADAVAGMETKVFSRLHAAYRKRRLNLEHHLSEETITEDFHSEFGARWQDKTWRLNVCPPKEIISSVNAGLQASGYRTISARSLSARISAKEVPTEMSDLVLSIEAQLSAPDLFV